MTVVVDIGAAVSGISAVTVVEEYTDPNDIWSTLSGLREATSLGVLDVSALQWGPDPNDPTRSLLGFAPYGMRGAANQYQATQGSSAPRLEAHIPRSIVTSNATPSNISIPILQQQGMSITGDIAVFDFDVLVIALKGSTGDYARWRKSAVIDVVGSDLDENSRYTTWVSTLAEAVDLVTPYKTAGASAWDFAATTDGAGNLRGTCTGAAASNIRWVMYVTGKRVPLAV